MNADRVAVGGMIINVTNAVFIAGNTIEFRSFQSARMMILVVCIGYGQSVLAVNGEAQAVPWPSSVLWQQQLEPQ
jgi:hypothetical protein